MATKKKMLQAAAGQAGGAGLDITDVFSTYLYDGTSASLTINNGLDLAAEDGMTWIKCRNAPEDHFLFSSLQNGSGQTLFLRSNTTGAAVATNGVSQTSTGFTVPVDGMVNQTGNNYASWTFRKAPKFFDVVTWSGNSTAGRAISHNLGSVPGMIIVKDLSNSSWDWQVFHRSVSGYGALNGTDAWSSYTALWNSQTPTDSEFYLGSDVTVNSNGDNYVAYLFAHNDGDGEFGADGDADIIKCGSYTGNESSFPTVDLGFEPQFILLKSATSTENWHLIDTMRGWLADGTNSSGDFKYLWANASNSEGGGFGVNVTSTGFELTSANAEANSNGNTFIYMAIRRGPLAQPESATEVFEVFETTNTGTASTIGSMGPSDFILNKRTDAAATWRALDRLRGGSMLRTDSTDTETSSGFLEWDKMGGVFVTAAGAPYITNDAQAHWMWKRAPGFFDVQAFTLGSSANREVKHNLQAIPEMIWWKERSDTSYWMFWHKDFTSSQYMSLHLSDAIATSTNIWGTSAPTSTGWYMKETAFGGSGNTCISYTFATVAGVSKVGSYTGNGSSQTIDCGFTSGARFVLVKDTTGGNWFVYDSVRGITSGSDPALRLNLTNAEVSTTNAIAPNSSGFIVEAAVFNNSGDSYIFYAIA